MDPWHYDSSEQLDQTMVERLRQFPREPDLLVYGLRIAAAVLLRAWMRSYHRLTIAGGKRVCPDHLPRPPRGRPCPGEREAMKRTYEGYGATELSPVAAGNIPPAQGPGAIRQGCCKAGTVGRPLPGMMAKIVDLAMARFSA